MMNIDIDSLALKGNSGSQEWLTQLWHHWQRSEKERTFGEGKKKITEFMNALMWSTAFSDMQRAHVREMDKISSQEAEEIGSETFRPLHLALPWLLVSDPRGINALKLTEA